MKTKLQILFMPSNLVMKKSRNSGESAKKSQLVTEETSLHTWAGAVECLDSRHLRMFSRTLGSCPCIVSINCVFSAYLLKAKLFVIDYVCF